MYSSDAVDAALISLYEVKVPRTSSLSFAAAYGVLKR